MGVGVEVGPPGVCVAVRVGVPVGEGVAVAVGPVGVLVRVGVAVGVAVGPVGVFVRVGVAVGVCEGVAVAVAPPPAGSVPQTSVPLR